MGFVSFITSEGNSLPNCNGSREPFPVWLVAPANTGCVTGAEENDGATLRWYEDCYGGYGEFGGKDIYVLTAELNGFCSVWLDHEVMRSVGISLQLGVEDQGADYNPAVLLDKVPEGPAWRVIGRLVEGAPIIIPRLTEQEDATWEELNPIKSCPNQGYFYD